MRFEPTRETGCSCSAINILIFSRFYYFYPPQSQERITHLLLRHVSIDYTGSEKVVRSGETWRRWAMTASLARAASTTLPTDLTTSGIPTHRRMGRRAARRRRLWGCHLAHLMRGDFRKRDSITQVRRRRAFGGKRRRVSGAERRKRRRPHKLLVL